MFLYIPNASYKSDPKKKNEWTAWPFRAIMLSGMEGGENRLVSAELLAVNFAGENVICPVPSTSICLTALSLIVSIFSLLSRTHIPSLMTNRKQCILHTSQQLFRP